MWLRSTFDDVVLLRQVHRHSADNDAISPDARVEYRADAARFLEVMRGMADLIISIVQGKKDTPEQKFNEMSWWTHSDVPEELTLARAMPNNSRMH